VTLAAGAATRNAVLATAADRARLQLYLVVGLATGAAWVSP
jgi:hypothetical protein